MDVELWPLLSVVIAVFGVIVTIAIFLWNKVSNLEDRLRDVEIGVARLDERTKPRADYYGEGTWRISLPNGEGAEE